MSPNTMNEVALSFVQMAKAYEELPQVQRELNEVNDHLIKALDDVRDRELRIHSLKAELEAKNEAIRSLEVAKDSAETMFLEADDRTARALDFVKTMFGSAGSLIQALEPEPTPEPVQSASPLEGSSNTDHTPTDQSLTSSASVPPQGQSEPDPTASMITQDTNTSANVSTETALKSEDATLPSEDLEPTRYDEHGNTRDAWFEWARRTEYWGKPKEERDYPFQW